MDCSTLSSRCYVDFKEVFACDVIWSAKYIFLPLLTIGTIITIYKIWKSRKKNEN
jgi:hypothetical protein